MAITRLGRKPVESIVKLNMNGVATEFIIIHQGLPGTMYDSSCNGTWVLIKDAYEKRVWGGLNDNEYPSSPTAKYMNSTYPGLFDPDIQPAIKDAKIPYVYSVYGGVVKSGANGFPAKAFFLSAAEVGWTKNTNQYFPAAGACLDYFRGTAATDAKRIAYLYGAPTEWWNRDPPCDTTKDVTTIATSVLYIKKDGGWGINSDSASLGIRFAMILSPDLYVTDDGTVIVNTAPTTPSKITIPGQINGGSTITLSWGAAADAEDNLEGYKVERSLDGGTVWTQIYQGGLTSTTNIVPFGSESVMYRVKAYDAEGLESGWKTSAQVTVINNTAPTVPGSLTVPETVQGGQPLAISWGASSDGENNLAGYSLERQVDGGDWEAVYSGPELSFTDQITKGWLTVAYRVRAYDTANAYSGFAVSEVREVNNNTPPAITCEIPANANLGVRSEGFEIPYTVEDEEGDEVTVTEAVDGTALRTFQAELSGSNSFRLTGEDFMKLLNGRHTLAITAADSASSAVHSLSFEKLVTSASVTLERPMEADGPISVCVLSVSGFIPADADYRVEVTNNALDDEPAWEDCAAAVRAGANHVFENQAAANGFAFNFRLNVSRGESGIGGYLTSIQGGFQ